MYKVLKGCYWLLERTVMRMLSSSAQLELRNAALRVANRLFPGRLIVSNAEELAALAHGHGWSPPTLPDWVMDELAEISAHIDPDLHPRGELVSSARFNAVPWAYSLPGDHYFSLRDQLHGRWDIVLFVPWLKSGGADLGAIHFANTLFEQFGHRVAVVATENSSSPWSSRLSEGVKFVEAGTLLCDLNETHRLDVLLRLVLQTAPHAIHIMNSRLAWEMVKRNGLAIRQQSKIYASLYCDDVTSHGQPVGYARMYLGACHQLLDGVIADNPITPAVWCGQIGVSAKLFYVVRFPAPQISPDQIIGTAPSSEVRVLWAGRLDRQKRPDILAAVARRMPEITFDVYGRAVMGNDDCSDLLEVKNVVMHGPYDRFQDLLAGGPALFLYTSQWDGLPNVLLEAAAAGLPIVASGVGGIDDFLAAEQLVKPFDEVNGYVELIRRLIAAPDLARSWQARQLARTTSMHSMQSFARAIADIPGYLSTVPSVNSCGGHEIHHTVVDTPQRALQVGYPHTGVVGP
ncbi:glycosyltransferase family 4 protein [Pseudoxanthomonas winnipegensis]|jgi:glycosyltransferase involved in cell wall biosynthesis|nr:glycosyltransferase family 4 protein [Pseudoxanthomonas winnipegensis]